MLQLCTLMGKEGLHCLTCCQRSPRRLCPSKGPKKYTNLPDRQGMRNGRNPRQTIQLVSFDGTKAWAHSQHFALSHRSQVQKLPASARSAPFGSSPSRLRTRTPNGCSLSRKKTRCNCSPRRSASHFQSGWSKVQKCWFTAMVFPKSIKRPQKLGT